MDEIQTLWERHLAATFPGGCRGAKGDFADLVMLEADTAGCVQTFLVAGGQLDLWRVAVLGVCYRDLAVALRVIPDEAQEYFSRLEKLAGLVLQAMVHKPPGGCR
jgi:hypothetical protein